MGRGPGVRAATKASIQIDFRYKGVRCRERIRLAPTPANIKYAARLKATIEHEIATNTFDYAKHFPDSPRSHKHAGPSGPALRTALLDYCDSLDGQLQPETLEEYRHDAEIVAEGLGATKPLYSIKRSDVREWIKRLNLTKKRINNLLIPLRGAFNQAVEDEEIDASPLAGFKVRKVEAAKEDTIDPFTPDEIAALGKQDLGEIWTFWAWSGPRSGEIIGFQWQDVPEDCSRIRVNRAVRVGREKVTKTHAGRRWIYLLAPAQAVLKRMDRGEPHDPIFRNPNTGERWHEDRGLARAFRRDCKAAGVRYRYPYQLRHTFATWALSSGENPKWASMQMGHKDVLTFFKIYAKWMAKLDPKAGSKMTKAAKSKAA
jgi:integrase